MPIYEFRCRDCGHKFEDLVSMGADAPACPKCQSSNTGKLLSTFAASVGGSTSACGSSSGCSGGGGFT